MVVHSPAEEYLDYRRAVYQVIVSCLGTTGFQPTEPWELSAEIACLYHLYPPNPPPRSRDLKTSPYCIGTKKCESELKCLRCRIRIFVWTSQTLLQSIALKFWGWIPSTAQVCERARPRRQSCTLTSACCWFMSDSIHCLPLSLPKISITSRIVGVFLVTWVIFGSTQQLWEIVQSLLTAMLCKRSPMELMSLCGGMPSLDWILESTLKVVANRGIAGIPTSSSGPLRMVWSSGAPRAESMADSEDLGAAQFGTDWQVFPQHKQSKRSAVLKKELFRVEWGSSTRDSSKTKSVFNYLWKECIVSFACLIFLRGTLSCIVWLQCGFMKRPCANGWLLRSSFARLANSFLICKLANVWSHWFSMV